MPSHLSLLDDRTITLGGGEGIYRGDWLCLEQHRGTLERHRQLRGGGESGGTTEDNSKVCFGQWFNGGSGSRWRVLHIHAHYMTTITRTCENNHRHRCRSAYISHRDSSFHLFLPSFIHFIHPVLSLGLPHLGKAKKQTPPPFTKEAQHQPETCRSSYSHFKPYPKSKSCPNWRLFGSSGGFQRGMCLAFLSPPTRPERRARGSFGQRGGR